MKPGNPLSMVYDEAVSFLSKINRADLVTTLPKNLGFAIGLDFRDGNLLLNSKNKTMFRARQVYNLSVGFHNIPLSEADVASVSGKSDIKKLKKYSLQVADTYVVKEMDVENGNDMPELLTKASKNAEDVVYTINEKVSDRAERASLNAPPNSHRMCMMCGLFTHMYGYRATTTARLMTTTTLTTARPSRTPSSRLLTEGASRAARRRSRRQDRATLRAPRSV